MSVTGTSEVISPTLIATFCNLSTPVRFVPASIMNPKLETPSVTVPFVSETVAEIPEKGEIESEVKLKLHESLLPVKNEKDKKLVREYFSKIFNVLSKELRAQIKDLKIPKKDKKELLKQLAFLNKQEQEKYIRTIIELYKELPIKLIERIRKLPNIKPQYYDKIIEQLKFMDDKEQLEFVQFLEKNA